MTMREIYNERPAEHAFTYTYAQPDEYHFCLDSIILAYFVSRQISGDRDSTPEFSALDLCAGCGVVGLELAYYHPWIERFDFLETQNIFRPFFERNLVITKNAARPYRFVEAHLRVLHNEDFRGRYDLIVANPPYFRASEGVAPQGSVRQRARFFGDASPADLWRAVESALKPGGRAFVLTRPGEAHGHRSEAELDRALSPECSWRIKASVRGTDVVEIRKRLVALSG